MNKDVGNNLLVNFSLKVRIFPTKQNEVLPQTTLYNSVRNEFPVNGPLSSLVSRGSIGWNGKERGRKIVTFINQCFSHRNERINVTRNKIVIKN